MFIFGGHWTINVQGLVELFWQACKTVFNVSGVSICWKCFFSGTLFTFVRRGMRKNSVVRRKLFSRCTECTFHVSRGTFWWNLCLFSKEPKNFHFFRTLRESFMAPRRKNSGSTFKIALYLSRKNFDENSFFSKRCLFFFLYAAYV